MGRAGRGGGSFGGGSRGGGFGGSRGFGSHSGGSSHRSSFSSSSHRSSYSSSSHHSSSYSSSSHHSSSYHSRYNGGPRFYYFGGTRYSGSSGYSGGYSNTPKKSGTSVWKKIWLVILILIIIGALLPDDKNTSSGSGGGITKSTVNRERFDSSSYQKSDVWYRDELNWITNPTTLHRGMEHFYDKTGVQPFLYITDDVGTKGYASDSQLEKFGNEIYDKYFDDECHLVVVFYEKDKKYRSFYVTGTQAKTVIDDEAGEILLDYIDHYYYSDYEESEFFSRSFSEAADRIMRVTPNYKPVIAIFAIIAVIVVLLFKWWKKKKQHKLDEMKQAKDILDSDLNEFGGPDYTGSGSMSEAEALKKKYDSK